MKKVVNGVEKELGIMDFEVARLSDRLGLIMFDNVREGHGKVKDVNGNDIDCWYYAVQCTNTVNHRQITVRVTYNTENKVALEEIQRKSKQNIFERTFIDFEDMVIGHYCSGTGNFANVSQTFKAERVKLVDQKEVQNKIRLMGNDQEKQHKQEN